MDNIIEILEHSVKKNGEISLTNKHLLNILRLAIKNDEANEHRLDMEASRHEIY